MRLSSFQLWQFHLYLFTTPSNHGKIFKYSYFTKLNLKIFVNFDQFWAHLERNKLMADAKDCLQTLYFMFFQACERPVQGKCGA